MLDAAEELIHEDGFDALTIGDLVQRSRTSVGSFYARFEDKDALLRAVQDRVLVRLDAVHEARMREEPKTKTLAEAVHGEVAIFVGMVSRDAPLVRAFTGHSSDPVLRDRAMRTSELHFAAYKLALRPHHAEIRHPSPERAVFFSYDVLATYTMALSWSIGATTKASVGERALTELSRMLLAYLVSGAEPKAPAPSRARRRS